MTKQLITSGQRKQILRFSEDAFEKALNEACLEKDGAQRIIEHGDEFSLAVKNSTLALFRNLSVSDKFKNEQVESTYGYLSGYKKPIKVSDQIDILHGFWPGLKTDKVSQILKNYSNLDIPDWIEGLFAIIRPEFFSDKYGEELEEVLKALSKSRKEKFINYRENQLGPEYLRQTQKTITALQKITEQQDSDILILPAQFGIKHRGKSVRRARETFEQHEFGTNSKDTATMLITHLNRLQHYDDLWIDCSGDEFSGAVDRFSRAPYFYFYGGLVKFNAGWFGIAHSRYGSVSGFSQ